MMAISTNPKPTIYRNLYENTGHACLCYFSDLNTREMMYDVHPDIRN